MVEVGGAGEVGRQAGDTENDLLGEPFAVEVAGVAADTEDLDRVGKQGGVRGCSADGAEFGTAVSTVVVDRGGVGEVGVGAGQQALRGGAGEGLVAP